CCRYRNSITSHPIAWSGRSVKEYKELKGLQKQSLRDNMTNTELVFNMLAEVSAKEISKKKQPVGLAENRRVAQDGGRVANAARLELESQTGESVVSVQNNLDNPRQIGD